jgi:hypothetical protein
MIHTMDLQTATICLRTGARIGVDFCVDFFLLLFVYCRNPHQNPRHFCLSSVVEIHTKIRATNPRHNPRHNPRQTPRHLCPIIVATLLSVFVCSGVMKLAYPRGAASYCSCCRKEEPLLYSQFIYIYI